MTLREQDIHLCTDILISEREMLRYGSEGHYRQNRIKSIFRLVK